jgi:hypothetical protein
VTRELSNQLVEVDAYIRLNVTRGLEDIVFNDWSHIGLIEGHTKTYLETASVTQTIARASETIIRQVGAITLGHISMSGLLLLMLLH